MKHVPFLKVLIEVSVGSFLIFGPEEEGTDGEDRDGKGREETNFLGGLPPAEMRGAVVTRPGREGPGVFVDGRTANDSRYCRSNFDAQDFHSVRLVGITGSA